MTDPESICFRIWSPRGGLFHEQVAEVHVHGLRLPRLLRQFRQRDAAKFPVLGFEAEVAVDDGAHLCGVDAEMDAARAELLSLDFRPERDQRHGEVIVCRRNCPVQHAGNLCSVEQCVLAMIGQRIGRRDQFVGIGEVAGEQGGVAVGFLRRPAQAAGEAR